MSSSSDSNLVVCSVLIKPARLLVFYKLRTWIDQVVKIVVHTFAAEESKLPLNSEAPDGYWYCAGDFCDIDEAGVYQHLIFANIEHAKCLVAQNIPNDHPDREKLVIAGEYGVNYVCHNITNRVLYATDNCNTLIDLDVKTTGYEVVVKSALGVYGQNKVEWERRKSKCRPYVYRSDSSSEYSDINNKPDRTRDEEILRIHLRATGGNLQKARNLTDALRVIDGEFYSASGELVSGYENGSFDESTFHSQMLNECAKLFYKTKNTVGYKMTQRIYPDCNIDIEIKDEVAEIEDKVLVAEA